MLTFSPLGEKVNTNMALIHQQVKKSTLGKIVNNHPRLLTQLIYPSVTKVKECNCDTLRLQSDQMYVMQDMKDDAILK